MSSPTLETQVSIGAAPNSDRMAPVVETTSSRALRWQVAFLSMAALNCIFQIAWFWRYSSHNINFDAISYIGIGRHIVDGHFRESLHGYWSPLISWYIAAGSVFSGNLVLVARVITISSFLLCLPVTYLLSFQIWKSHSAASLSVLCFTLARGVVAFSVYFIGADFLITAAVGGYFIILLQCLRKPTSRNWLGLGGMHGVAFLTKAFAMPWLSLSTLLGIGLLYNRRPKRLALCAALALAIPVFVWLGWGMLLRTKYGRFTAGYQSKLNLLPVDLRDSVNKRNLSVLTDAQSNDNYMVVDEMYPSSPLWKTHLPKSTLARLLEREYRNLPEALKQLMILITPGGLLALGLALSSLRRYARRPDNIWTFVTVGSAFTLISGYCMLVFDARYVLPLAPLLLALSSRFLWPIRGNSSTSLVNYAPATMFIGSIIFLGFYSGSPLRSLRNDYQSGIYSVSTALKQIPQCDRLVSIGSGPFPQHGVGWEAGIYASYFAQCRIVGFSSEVPAPANFLATAADIEHLGANSVLVFGNSNDRDITVLLEAIRATSTLKSMMRLQVWPGKEAFLLWNDHGLSLKHQAFGAEPSLFGNDLAKKDVALFLQP